MSVLCDEIIVSYAFPVAMFEVKARWLLNIDWERYFSYLQKDSRERDVEKQSNKYGIAVDTPFIVHTVSYHGHLCLHYLLFRFYVHISHFIYIHFVL